MSFRPYPNYKPSGVAWIGEVPADWRVVPLTTIAKVINGYPFDAELFSPDGGYPLVRIRDLGKTDTESRYGGDFIAAAAVTSEDLLIGMDGDFNVGRWMGAGEALLNQRLCCVRGSTPAITRLLEYTLVQPLKAINDVTYSTTVKHLSSLDVKKLRVPLPSQERELLALVAFLDRETGKIDALVEEQKRLIALLKEKRQAVISHAVTKGLDLNVPMKPSGVEWLGDVPEHWEVRPLKYLVDFESGGTPSKANPEYWDGDVPWVSAKDLKRDVLSDTQDHITDTALAEGAASLVPTGTVVVLVRGMMLARAFPVVRLAAPMAINQDLKALVCSLLRMEYLAWALRGLERECLSRIDEAGHGTKALRMEAWTSMEFPQPPDEEQERIAKHLDTATKSLDELVSAANAAIELLKERRSALVSAAVTGKIDVRELDQNRGEAA